MSVVGLPHTRRWNRTLCIEKNESSIESDSSVMIGTTPFKSGMPKSCIGTAARSEMSSISTSSMGSSSPIWRLPMARMPTIRITYNNMVRANAVAMSYLPFWEVCPNAQK